MLARERGSKQDGGGEGQQLEGACGKALNVAQIQPRGRLSKHSSGRKHTHAHTRAAVLAQLFVPLSGDRLDTPSADPELAPVCWLLVLHAEPRPLVAVERFEQVCSY